MCVCVCVCVCECTCECVCCVMQVWQVQVHVHDMKACVLHNMSTCVHTYMCMLYSHIRSFHEYT